MLKGRIQELKGIQVLRVRLVHKELRVRQQELKGLQVLRVRLVHKVLKELI